MSETYVMPEPQVKIDGGEFSFTGRAVHVTPTAKDKALDYLGRAGVYDSQANVWNGSVYFNDDFSVEGSQEIADEVLAIFDEQRLIKDLEKNGYAFVMAAGNPGKFKDYKNKGFITNIDRVIQDLIYQKIPGELELGFGVRHLSTQESVELMGSDEEFREVMESYWIHNFEVIQEMDVHKASGLRLVGGNLELIETYTDFLTPIKIASFRSLWHRGGARAYVSARRPLLGDDYGVAALKKVPLPE